MHYDWPGWCGEHSVAMDLNLTSTEKVKEKIEKDSDVDRANSTKLSLFPVRNAPVMAAPYKLDLGGGSATRPQVGPNWVSVDLYSKTQNATFRIQGAGG